MTLADDIARVRRRLAADEWGMLQFSYARSLDTCSVDTGAVLVDAGAGASAVAGTGERRCAPASGDAGEDEGAGSAGEGGRAAAPELFIRFVVELVRRAREAGVRVHIAEDAASDGGESPVRRAVREAGLAGEAVWVRRRSRRYMRLLACAGLLVGTDEAFPFFMVKRPGQRLVCLPDAARLAALDRHAVSDAEHLGDMQHVFLASDWIACPDEQAMRHLAHNAMIAQLYRGAYVVPAAFCGLDEFAGRLAALACAGGGVARDDEGDTARPDAADAAVSGGLVLVPGESLHADGPLVALYGDTLKRTGIETSLRNLLAHVDASRARIVVLCSPHAIRDGAHAADYDGEAYLNSLPDNLSWLGFHKGRNLRVREALAWTLHVKLRRRNAWTRRKLDAVFAREHRRVFAGTRFDAIVHFTGYDFEMAQLMLHEEHARTAIFIHNDMERELAVAGNVDVATLQQACANFDAVCLVGEALREPLRRVVGTLDDARVFTVHNVCDADAIRAGAQRPLSRDDYEECSCSFAELEALLAGGDGPVFVWLGRFVEQKGCDRLLEAFSAFVASGGKGRLVMAGSTGELYGQVREAAARIESGRVVVIRALANPYALLARADALVLASRYEGMPMVVMEALSLGTPVICTDMPGVGEFLREGGLGQVVENSTAGIEDGLVDFAAGTTGPFTRFDVEAFNTRALAEFYAALGL